MQSSMPRSKNDLLRCLFCVSSNGETRCNNGKCDGKILSCHAGNLERHLKSVHSAIYNDYMTNKGRLTLNTTKGDLKISCSINKKTAEMAIVELFTKCGRPLHMVEDRPFKVLTKPIFDALNVKLNKHSLIEQIVQHSCNLKDEISKQLKGRLLSLKVDAATRLHLSVLGINVQYINNNCITIKTLAIRELKERHTSDYLKTMILEVLSEYHINLNQIITVTTDNGANMVKAIRDLNEETYCEIKADNELQSSELNELHINIDFTMDNITNVRCGAHTLQLCVMDVIKAKVIKSKLENLRTVSKKLRTQTYLSLLKTGKLKKPIIDCPTRWNSTYLMLERLMELKDFINSLGRDYEVFKICDDDWSFVAEFLKSFKIIYTASIKLQSHDLIYSDLYIQMMNVSLQLESLPKSEVTSTLISSVHTRKSKLFDNDLFITAVFLDPRVKSTLTAEQVARAKSCFISLHTRLCSLKENEPSTLMPSAVGSSNTETPPSLSTSVNGFEDPLEAYLQGFDKQTSTDESSQSKIIERDFFFYEQQSRLGINENVIQFWCSQKNTLAEIAVVVLAIPCTQVSVERLFSALKYIFADQRNSFNSNNLEHILLVKANDDFDYED